MKWPKRLLLVVGVIVIITGLVYGFLAYKKYEIKQKLVQARACFQEGQFSAALNYLQVVEKKSPQTAEGIEALYLLGECYLNLDQLEPARLCWEKLHGLAGAEGYQAECLYRLAAIAAAGENIHKAQKYYEKLIADYPQSALVDDALWDLAQIYKEQKELLKAKEYLSRIIEQYPGSNLVASAQQGLGDINISILFSPMIIPGSEQYIVQKGDTLATIAARFKTNVPLLKRCNNLKSDFIKPGQPLKVVTAKFSIAVDKSRNTMLLKQDEQVLKIYPVGSGVEGCTPAGDFVITNKMINPPWYKSGEGVVPYGDPRNVLGTRWLGFDLAGYGIHGTWEPESIGKQSSAGCIRLLNEDVEELYAIVPTGTIVTIVE